MKPITKAACMGGLLGLTIGAFAGALLGVLGPIGACALLGIVLAGVGAFGGALYAEGHKP